MTLAELRALAERDLSSRDLRRSKAGAWAVETLEKIAARDWQGATVAIAHAIVERPEEYAAAFLVVMRAKGGVSTRGVTSPAKASASRLNGAKGGRPRKHPEGWRAAKQSTRKPGETRGRKPKAQTESDVQKAITRTALKEYIACRIAEVRGTK